MVACWPIPTPAADPFVNLFVSADPLEELLIASAMTAEVWELGDAGAMRARALRISRRATRCSRPIASTCGDERTLGWSNVHILYC